jgi:NAD(P)-dependent dehydrogenase (short-subunit alcohol dehydrogenase family)
MSVAILTGADSGIGKATAVELARGGYDIGITWFDDEDGARRTIDEVRGHGVRGEARELDLREPLRAVDVIDELIDALGDVDVLVNNAGKSESGAFVELTFERWREVIAVNLDGPFVCAQRAVRRMREQGRGGVIVNVTSVHEFAPLEESTPYVVSKHGLGGLTKQLALELAADGIRVNSVAPGMIATPMTKMEDVDPRTVSKPRIPAGRPGDAREIASCIAWLCSDGAGYATGASFVVDGGFLLVNPSALPDEG